MALISWNGILIKTYIREWRHLNVFSCHWCIVKYFLLIYSDSTHIICDVPVFTSSQTHFMVTLGDNNPAWDKRSTCLVGLLLRGQRVPSWGADLSGACDKNGSLFWQRHPGSLFSHRARQTPAVGRSVKKEWHDSWKTENDENAACKPAIGSVNVPIKY